MREHMGLYRGKRADNGEWVEGCLLQIGEARKFDPNVPFSNCYIVPETDADVVMWINNDRTIALDIEAYHVDPTTIGECTGLKDKNGKLIFEGDIVTFETTVYLFKPCVIKWSFTKMRFIAKGCEASYPMNIDFKYEIIGNIHDNGELLKGGEG